MSSSFEDSIISLPSASSLSIDNVGRESQEDVTLTSLEEGDNMNIITFSDASSLVSTEQNDQSIVSLSDASSIT